VNPETIKNELNRTYLEQWQQHGDKFAQVGLGGSGLDAVAAYYRAKGQSELAAKFRDTAAKTAIAIDNDIKEFIQSSPYVKQVDKDTWSQQNLTQMTIDVNTGLIKESTLDSFLSSWTTRNMMFWDFKSRYTPNDQGVMNPMSAIEKKATQEIFSNLTPKDAFDLALSMLNGSDSPHPESKNTNISNVVAHALGEPEISFFLQYSKFAGIDQAKKSYFDFKTHMGKSTEIEQKLQLKASYGKLVSAVRELYGVNEMQARGMSAFVVSKTPVILTAKETLEKGLSGDTISAVDKYFERAKSSDTVLKGLIVPGSEMIKNGKKNLVKQLEQLSISENNPVNLYEAIKAGKDGLKIGEETHVFTIKNSHVTFNDFIVTQRNKANGKIIAQQTITMLPQSSWWEFWS
jgi:type III secretion system FlhB-like substrate exporter